MLNRIIMHIIDVPIVVVLVANNMIPKAVLSHSASCKSKLISVARTK